MFDSTNEETELLPTFEELKETIYQLKAIDELEEDDDWGKEFIKIDKRKGKHTKTSSFFDRFKK